MRLIDADKLKQWLCGLCISENGDTEKTNALCKMLDYTPTAYDVDKVVERLESFPELEVTQYPLHGKYLKKDSVLKIVRGGGVDE